MFFPNILGFAHLACLLPKIVVFPLPVVLCSHDRECVPCEQMKNIPMVEIPPENSRQKQFYKEQKAGVDHRFTRTCRIRRTLWPESAEK